MKLNKALITSLLLLVCSLCFGQIPIEGVSSDSYHNLQENLRTLDEQISPIRTLSCNFSCDEKKIELIENYNQLVKDLKTELKNAASLHKDTAEDIAEKIRNPEFEALIQRRIELNRPGVNSYDKSSLEDIMLEHLGGKLVNMNCVEGPDLFLSTVGHDQRFCQAGGGLPFGSITTVNAPYRRTVINLEFNSDLLEIKICTVVNKTPFSVESCLNIDAITGEVKKKGLLESITTRDAHGKPIIEIGEVIIKGQDNKHIMFKSKSKMPIVSTEEYLKMMHKSKYMQCNWH